MSDTQISSPPQTQELTISDTKAPSQQEVEENSSAASVEQDMSDTFATVWVKVEVCDDEDSSLPTANINPIGEKPRKKRKQKRPEKKLYCDKCEYSTVYKNCLKGHMLGHLNEKPYSCTLCPYASIFSASLSRHIALKHAGETGVKVRWYQCQSCDYKTAVKCNLQSHERKHFPEKTFKCDQCSYESAYRHNLLKHMKCHHQEKTVIKYRCDKCPFETKHDGHIKRHLAVIHNEIAVGAKMCDMCGFVTRLNWRLTIHKNRSKREEQMKCALCDFETYFSCELKKHRKSHLGEVYLNGRIINENLIRKIESISTENSTDDQCDNMQDLEMSDLPENIDEVVDDDDVDLEGAPQDKHGKKHHYVVDPECLDWHSIQVLESEDKEKPFQCLLCEYTSKFKAAVQRHFQRNHTSSEKRPYKCVNCDFSTKTKDQIALHDKRSKSETLVRCKMCNFSTYYKCKLVMHKKSHYDFKCSQCDYCCKDKYGLAKHFNTYHLGIVFNCQYCDYKGTRKESVVAHTSAIHTLNKPFKCPLCEYTAIRMCLIEHHVKKHHGQIQDALEGSIDALMNSHGECSEKSDVDRHHVKKNHGQIQDDMEGSIDSLMNSHGECSGKSDVDS